MEQQKRKRAENWSSKEKEMLRHLIAKSSSIIENKSNKASANFQKNKEWKNIINKMNELTGKIRLESEVKMAWKRMKLAAKANLSSHRQHLMCTGSGEKPKSPSQEDLAIMVIAPQDFIIQFNEYDSDAVPSTVQILSDLNETESGPAMENKFSKYNTQSQPDEPQPNSECIEMIMDKGTSEMHKVSSTPRKKWCNMKKKKSIHNKQTLLQESIESNTQFKKKQLEMSKVEHEYNVKIAKLNIKKLELEIELLERKKTSNI